MDDAPPLPPTKIMPKYLGYKCCHFVPFMSFESLHSDDQAEKRYQDSVHTPARPILSRAQLSIMTIYLAFMASNNLLNSKGSEKLMSAMK